VRACEARARLRRCGSIPRCTPTSARVSIHTWWRPGPDDCDFFTGAVGTDGYGLLHLPRGSGICVRPHRYALARWLTVPLGLDELGLHERDMPLCVKVCGMDRPRQHASVRSVRSQAAVRNAAPIRGDGPRSWLSQYLADQIYIGAAQGRCRQNARPIRAIRRLSNTFSGAMTFQLAQHKPRQTWHPDVSLERARLRLGEGPGC
jgi:hypothetical protein